VEETPKKCRDIIKTAKSILSDNQFEVFGEDPKVRVSVIFIVSIVLEASKRVITFKLKPLSGFFTNNCGILSHYF